MQPSAGAELPLCLQMINFILFCAVFGALWVLLAAVLFVAAIAGLLAIAVYEFCTAAWGFPRLRGWIDGFKFWEDDSWQA